MEGYLGHHAVVRIPALLACLRQYVHGPPIACRRSVATSVWRCLTAERCPLRHRAITRTSNRGRRTPTANRPASWSGSRPGCHHVVAVGPKGDPSMNNSGRHLVYLVSEYLPATGGTTTQIRNESKEALRRGWTVSIFDVPPSECNRTECHH